MDAAQELSNRLAALVEGAAPSVVRVEGPRRASATGTVWSAELVMVAHHSLEWDEGIEIDLADGGRRGASLAGRDPGTDLALLKVEGGGLTAPSWADTASLRVGHLVLGLSRPGRTLQSRLGMVSAVGEAWRTPAGGRIDRSVQTDIPLHPGFSGGPLVDTGGSVVGINTAGLLRGVAAVVPPATLRRVAEALLAHGRLRRGYLGIGSQPVRLPPTLEGTAGQPGGLLIVSVQPGSPADAAGLMLGDVLVAIEGAPLRHPSEVLSFLDEERIGSTLGLRLLRAGQPREAAVVVGAREAA